MATSSSATPAAISASRSTAVGTGIARSASRSCARSGCRSGSAELLPVEYFHVVFTVPQEIAAIAYQNKAVVYDILFRATAETLRTIAADPKHLGAEIGFIAVLHTWGQTLMHHPHLHCVVPGGGMSPDGQRWVACRPGFFLPVRVLSALFRRLFLTELRQAFDDKASCTSSTRCAALQDTGGLRQVPRARRRRGLGGLRQEAPSAGPSRSSSISAATRIAWRSPTTGCSNSPKARSRSSWKDYRQEFKAQGDAAGRRGVHASLLCCMCCRRACSAFATTGCWRTATARSSWSNAAELLQAPRRSPRSPTTQDYRTGISA